MKGLISWAKAYYAAAEQLHLLVGDDRHSAFYCGPVMQTTGLATELTLKAMLLGWGLTSGQIKQYRHNTYKSYCDARKCFNEVAFTLLHLSNTCHLKTPEEVRIRLESASVAAGDIDTR